MKKENITPEEIRNLRKQAGLTQAEAAKLVCGAARTWQDWEAGTTKMHPGLYKLFNIEAERIIRENLMKMQEKRENTFWVSNFIRNGMKSLDEIIAAINDGGIVEGMEAIKFTPEMLAGEYAFYAAKDQRDVSEENLYAHLEILQGYGASFDFPEALKHAEAITQSAHAFGPGRL